MLSADGPIGKVYTPQQGTEAGSPSKGQDLQTPLDNVAVFVAQGHEVGHGTQGGEFQKGWVIGLAKMMQESGREFVSNARAAQVWERISIVGHPGVDDGDGVRKLRRGHVMVGDDDVGSFATGEGNFGEVADAGIHGDDERSTLPDETLDGQGGHAVTLGHGIRQVRNDPGAEAPEGFAENRGCR